MSRSARATPRHKVQGETKTLILQQLAQQGKPRKIYIRNLRKTKDGKKNEGSNNSRADPMSFIA